MNNGITYMRGIVGALLLGLALAGSLARAQTPAYVGFEARQVHPLALTPDGTKLLALHSEAAALCVFDVTSAGATPTKIADLSVGLEPVTVRARTNDEIWVVNELSDTVTVLSLSAAGTIAVLPTGDEPADVVFAGGKAFVSCGRDNEVWVYDAATRALITQVPLQGLVPSALAVSEDESKVFAAFLHSGNGTTVLRKSLAPAPPAPTGPGLPVAPQTALIVAASDSRIPYTVVDHDIAELNVATNQVTRYAGGLGTNLLGLAVRPTSGEVWASHTEALNLIRFEPELNGRFALSRLGIFDPSNGTVDVADLNPGVDYDLLPNPGAQSVALSQPTAIEFESDGAHLWTAAFASDRVARIDASSGNVLTRVDLRPGGADSAEMRGPRGLALQESTGRLFVLNKLRESLSIVDTTAPVPAVTEEISLSVHEPLPAEVKAGRGYLFDARLSGNGLVSCGICHLDADRDGLAWDLGDPAGALLTVLGANLSVHDSTPRTRVMHPMKGPMVTQTLRGLKGIAPFHWRGDKPGIADFNPTFSHLMGGEEISAEDMADLEAYLMTLQNHPNPNRNLDRTLPATLGDGAPPAGRDLFNSHNKSHCITCHAYPAGSDNNIDLPQETGQSQPMKTVQLRTIYQRNLLNPRVGATSLSGFGLLHDGTGFELPTVHPYVLDNLNTTKELKDVSAFLLCFDTGTAPVVGHMALATVSNRAATDLLAKLALLETRAAAGDGDLVVQGKWNGAARRWLYRPTAQLYRADTGTVGSLSRSALLAGLTGDEAVTFLGVPPGQGERLGGDVDQDGVVDGDDPSLTTYDGAPRIVGEPDDVAAVPGASFTLTVEVRGGSPQYQWYKADQLLPGEVGATLTRAAAVTGDAGNYRVTVQNSVGGATSRTAKVEVYPAPVITVQPLGQTINEGRSAVLAVTATGTALSYQWWRGNQPVNGATSRILSFAEVQGLDAGSYSIVISNGAGSVTSDPAQLTVIERPVVPAHTLSEGMIGQLYTTSLTATNGPTRFAVSGLPKGLSVPVGSAQITGRPLVSGDFPVRITASNSAGSSVLARDALLKIHEFPTGALGLYQAVLSRHSVLNGGLGGLLSVTTFQSSAFSGVIRLGGAAYSFRQAWVVSNDTDLGATVRISRARAKLPELVLELELDPMARSLSGRISSGGEEILFTDGVGVLPATSAVAFAGAYTAALEPPLADAGNEDVPQGDSVTAFAVSTKGAVSGRLRLADQSELRFAGWIGEGGWSALHLVYPRNAGSVNGRLHLATGTRRLEASALTWSKVASPASRSFPSGFGPLALRTTGGPYVVPAVGQSLPGLDNAAVLFTGGKAPDPATRLNVSEVVFPVGAAVKGQISVANPGLVSVALVPGSGVRFVPGATGGFSGGFVLQDPDPTTAGNPLLTRRTTFRGMIVDDGSGLRGYGHFVLPEMPAVGPPLTTLRTSLLRSGRVRLNPIP